MIAASDSPPLRVASIGQLLTDVVLPVEHLPVCAGEHQRIESIQIEPGGAGNFLVAGARLGLEMSALGLVGDDYFGTVMIEALSAEGVDVSGVSRPANSVTATCFTLVDKSAQHVFIGRSGIGPTLSFDEHWRCVVGEMDAIQTWGYALGEPYLSDALVRAMEFAHLAGCPVFFDPGPPVRSVAERLRREALSHCDVVLLTEDELPLIADGRTGEAAVELALTRGPSLVCVKRGANGSVAYRNRERVEHPGFPVEVRDTTAAGDAFAAAFVYAQLRGWSLVQTVSFANACGAAKVRKLGAGRQVPTRSEVFGVLREHNIDPPSA